MVTSMYFGLVALLYYACFLLLGGLALFIACNGGRRPRARSRLRRVFSLLALCLLLWQLTLFLEVRTAQPAAQLWLGRANFAVVAVGAFLALRFVQEIPGKRSVQGSPASWRPVAETGLITALTLLTPLVDAAERVDGERALTTFGPLLPLYLLHILGYWLAALALAFQRRRLVTTRRRRWQLTLVGSGLLITGVIAFLCNALLPYDFGDFRFCHLGVLSSMLFGLAVAYATLVHGLFDSRVVLRETLVFGILLAIVGGIFSTLVVLVTQYVTGDRDRIAQIAVILIAFSLDPLRRFLEKEADRLLFGKRGEEDTERTLPTGRQTRR